VKSHYSGCLNFNGSMKCKFLGELCNKFKEPINTGIFSTMKINMHKFRILKSRFLKIILKGCILVLLSELYY
jgi:hypothetical protein